LALRTDRRLVALGVSMGDPRFSVVFSNHRLETLPLAEAQMRLHEVVVLEEPPSASFADMLADRLSIEAYTDELELEFPAFTRASCAMLRELAVGGITFIQSDPYLEVLLSIHDLFDHGGRPADVDQRSVMGTVYRMEQRWTAALLGFYTCSGSDDFDRVVTALQRFARVDARRGRFRDRLRAAAIPTLVSGFRAVYIEAGSIHLPLLGDLRRELGKKAAVRPFWITESVTRQLARCRQLIGPGDELTLRYAFRPSFSGGRADLLAARSLIYVKLLVKEEVLDSAVPFPHIRSEFEAMTMVSRLSYDDCRLLYPRVRSVSIDEARAIVGAYL
jgi:hypothetical protein